MSDLDTLDGDRLAQQQEDIASKNAECQGIYEDISNNIGSSNTVNRCTLLSNKITDLLDEIQERFEEEDALVENGDETADSQTLENIVDLRDSVALLDLDASEFCNNLIYIPDPSTALGNSEYNGQSGNT